VNQYRDVVYMNSAIRPSTYCVDHMTTATGRLATRRPMLFPTRSPGLAASEVPPRSGDPRPGHAGAARRICGCTSPGGMCSASYAANGRSPRSSCRGSGQYVSYTRKATRYWDGLARMFLSQNRSLPREVAIGVGAQHGANFPTSPLWSYAPPLSVSKPFPISVPPFPLLTLKPGVLQRPSGSGVSSGRKMSAGALPIITSRPNIVDEPGLYQSGSSGTNRYPPDALLCASVPIQPGLPPITYRRAAPPGGVVLANTNFYRRPVSWPTTRGFAAGGGRQIGAPSCAKVGVGGGEGPESGVPRWSCSLVQNFPVPAGASRRRPALLEPGPRHLRPLNGVPSGLRRGHLRVRRGRLCYYFRRSESLHYHRTSSPFAKCVTHSSTRLLLHYLSSNLA